MMTIMVSLLEEKLLSFQFIPKTADGNSKTI